MTLDDDTCTSPPPTVRSWPCNARTGAEVWRQSALLHRGLTAPANMDDNAIVLADFQGYVHWLDKASGTIIGAHLGRQDAGEQRAGRRRATWCSWSTTAARSACTA